LFAPELPGHAERLDAVLTDALPAVVLTTAAVSDAVQKFVRLMPRDKRPRIIAVDAIPDTVGSTFSPMELDTDDIAYLQYTSGLHACRPAWRSLTAPRNEPSADGLLHRPGGRDWTSTASAGCRCITTWA
jgi:hypothetical protein